MAISSLVVRCTFYLIDNDCDLALKIRLLFSINIQLSVVEYIVQPIVVIVNHFLKKLKIFFKGNYNGSCGHLKTLRKQAKMTQAQVAKAIEISQQGYAYWEQGKKRPSHDNLVKIAKLFNVSVDTLVSNKTNDDIDLSEVELLFRTTSDGMSNEEKEIFKQELLHFMKERKKLFDDKKNFSTD